MATSYYDITLRANIPHGSDILNKPCTVVFSYPDGSSSSYTYSGTLFAWFTPNTVRISSAQTNIEAGWVGANGGILTINTGGGLLTYAISGFAKVP